MDFLLLLELGDEVAALLVDGEELLGADFEALLVDLLGVGLELLQHAGSILSDKQNITADLRENNIQK